MEKKSRKRQTLSIEIKIEIIKMYLENTKITLEEIQKIFKKKYFIKIGKSTLSEIISNREKWLNSNKTCQKRTKMSVGKFPELESALFIWISQMNLKNIPLNESMVVEKAKFFGDQLKIDKDFKYSNGWLEKFKDRFGLRKRVLHGESGNVNQCVVSSAIDFMNLITESYEKDNIFNMDETALFYELAPNQTLACKNVQGKKLSKKRITVALCSNSTGTIKIKPLIINTSKNPRLFKEKKFNPLLHVIYKSNKKAWMTGVIFNEFLDFLNEEMIQLKKHILLLIDNASSHVPIKKYSNINIKFIPPNLTAHIQPMDAGIIRSFKSAYRKQIVELLVKNADNNVESKIDIISAIKFISSAWELVTPRVINNCFVKTKIIKCLPNMLENIKKEEFEEELLPKVFFAENNIETKDFYEYLNIDQHEETGNNFTENDIIDMVTADTNEQEEKNSEAVHLKDEFEIKENPPKLISNVIQNIKYIEEHLNEAYELDCADDLKFKSELYCLLNKYKNKLIKRKAMNGRQTKLTEFFNKK